jgi:phosphoadenosine phosphosulfate reductase
VRKVEPLQAKLKELDAWICGLRQEQAVTRTAIKKIEFDRSNNLVKLNPLASWTTEDVWEYIRKNNVPYNKLHDKGFPSIGCGPCTREVGPDQDIRAGRWWWEDPDKKECGLHCGK